MSLMGHVLTQFLVNPRWDEEAEGEEEDEKDEGGGDCDDDDEDDHGDSHSICKGLRGSFALGASWRLRGAIFGPSWGHVRSFRSSLGGPLGPSWKPWRQSWKTSIKEGGVPTIIAPLQHEQSPTWAPPGALSGPSWSFPGHIFELSWTILELLRPRKPIGSEKARAFWRHVGSHLDPS